MMEFLFWLLLIILFYSYAGYGMILWVLVRFKRILKPRKPYETPAVFEPEVTLFVTAFNEKDYIARKVDNSFSLDYPKEKVQYI
ncbi:MAG: hypothetical protein WBK43_04580, partial [Prolixibacteraceae bacterium]